MPRLRRWAIYKSVILSEGRMTYSSLPATANTDQRANQRPTKRPQEPEPKPQSEEKTSLTPRPSLRERVEPGLYGDSFVGLCDVFDSVQSRWPLIFDLISPAISMASF